MVSGFLIGSERDRRRLLRRVGGLTVVAAVVVGLVIAYVIPAVTPKDENAMTVTIDTPSVGPGVENGTDVVLRGAPVGKVSALAVNSNGTSSITVDLDKGLVQGMGQDFTLDFRPKNYFGITGITITDPGDEARGPLRDGDHLTRTDIVDNTLSTMIELGSDVANGTLVPETVNAIKRVVVYSGAFQPLLHTGVVVADTIARTQRETPAYLLDRYNEIVNSLPPFADGAFAGLEALYSSPIRLSGDDIQNRFSTSLASVSTNFFAMVGTLLKSNQSSLTPLLEVITRSAGVLPAIGAGVVTPTSVNDLLTRLDGAFADGPNGTTVLKVNLALQSLPSFGGVLSPQSVGAQARRPVR